MNSPIIWICVLLVALGVIFHFLTKLSELESQGQIVSPWTYWRQHPYTSLTVILGAYLFMSLQFAINELTYTGAILTGIACNSIGDKLRAKASTTLDK